jgi:hypothetical protein
VFALNNFLVAGLCYYTVAFFQEPALLLGGTACTPRQLQSLLRTACLGAFFCGSSRSRLPCSASRAANAAV